ncbi:3-oxoacyl-ACP reductase [Carnobacterium maltaromaticum]|uniref:3-oxoacyl-ACP reductase n=1 Tax=Carnobacterium maltaromaticum TaxID=2751 RepID=UPI00295F18CB|nr:3-oxoacyl-ACP reductase [Carnobacterium maltaromaticum]MDW5524152.1 3-oxoacyl-ACP reductase [Carnobacterium maltaromaticum]
MIIDEFKKKVVFITGISSGIGLAQAEGFLKQGATVFGMDIVEPDVLTNAVFQNSIGRNFAYLTGDVTQPKDVEEAVKTAISTFGKIDILLNTAGILDNYTPTLETDEALWDRVLNTNLKGMYFVANAILPGMLEQKHGVIVNMASIAGLVAGGGGAAYTTAKHGIIGYTKQLDYDYAKHGIRCNAIAPGAIETPMNKADFAGTGEMAKWVAKETPAGRWAQPKEVADLTLFLASSLADYIHGTVLPIDGGWLEK